MRTTIGVLATVFAATALNAQVTQPARTDVPIKTVMLFSSGVGYFEHAGSVRNDGSTELRFNSAQINDILKSLIVQDLDGGRVTTITYPSQDPLAKTLRSFQVDITSNPSLADLLNQLRGAKITVQTQADKLSGTILGVEMRTKAVERGEPVAIPVLNVLSGANIRAVELQAVNNLSLDDPQLQDELVKALSALSQARDQDKKPVVINFTGSGERRMRIGYVVETPVWKTSYRLMLDEKSARLQGWAIVENQTENDWTGVSLSLVSGRPMSFSMDLYQPLYVTRPIVTPELFGVLAPQVYDAGIGDRERVALAAPVPSLRGQGGGRGGRDDASKKERDASAPAAEAMVMNEAISRYATSTVQSAATTARMGELFQFTVANVTLPRQKSAMIPIITDSIVADKLSIYNASVLATNPLNGVRLKNTTGKLLLQGPITVLEKSGYAGDARIDDVPQGQERLLSYGVDLEMKVDNTKNSQTSAVTTARIYKGVMTLDRKYVTTREYAAENKSDHDKVLVIEHPITQGAKLADTPKPVETTPTLYRFQATCVAKKISVLTVKEESVASQSVTLLQADPSALISYSRTGEIPADVRAALAKAIQLKQAVVDSDRQIADRTQQVNSISQEQNRIRENMKTVSSTTQYYTRLLAKLNEQESSIEKLQIERDDLGKRRAVQQAELENYLGTLTIG